MSHQRVNYISNVNAAFLLDSFSILALFAQITVSLNLIRKNLKMLCEKGLLVIIASLSSIIRMIIMIIIISIQVFWFIHMTTSILNLPLATTFYLKVAYLFLAVDLKFKFGSIFEFIWNSNYSDDSKNSFFVSSFEMRAKVLII